MSKGQKKSHKEEKTVEFKIIYKLFLVLADKTSMSDWQSILKLQKPNKLNF